MIAPEKLPELIEVDFSTGRMFWRRRNVELFNHNHNTQAQNAAIWNTRYAGKEAFTTSSHGYKVARIFNERYFAHRVIWAMAHGYWPKLIDHINRNKADNRLVNLREANKSQNGLNSKVRSDNTSGFRGVTRHQGRWMCQAKGRYIGMYDCPKDAHQAYLNAVSE